ncbi:MAG: pilus assembly protein PilP [Methylomonas lenta]|nr:pilus assembly protein PilP [Methylomonas lenta]
MIVRFKSLAANRSITLLCSALLSLLTACANDDLSDLNRFIQEVKSRPKGTIQPLPENKIVETYIFQPQGLRDPFQPSEKNTDEAGLDTTGVGGIRPDTDRRKEELEAFSLDSLRMMGTLNDHQGLWGLIKAKDGTIHSVQVGNHMGQNYGKITRILEDRIELMEIVPDKPGTWREQQATLALAE